MDNQNEKNYTLGFEKPKTEINDKSERIMNGVNIWCSFYRANPHRFAKDYLHIDLAIFQQILIMMMSVSTNFLWTASRGIGKTFLLSVFCCIRCTIYPETKIIVVAKTRGQSIEVIEKIIRELIPKSDNLAREIKNYSLSPADAYIEFWNGSYLKVVTSNDGARHNRANIIFYDEYRMIPKGIIDTVIKKFIAPERKPKFFEKPQYKNYPKERNQQFFTSSCWFKNHWSWDLFTSYCVNMMNDDKKYFVCGLPYQLAIQEGLLNKEQVEDEMSESTFNATLFEMESGCLFHGENENAFYNYESLTNIRRIHQALYPKLVYDTISHTKLIKYPQKIAGEIRLLTADIAVMGSKKNKNDATAIFILQLIPTKDGQYIRNVLYSENYDGGHTEEQALQIRRLYDEMECDYIVMDTNGVGIGVYDNLVTDLIDEDTGIMYEALSCINDVEMASRYKGLSKTPPKVIYSIKASAAFNSQCAFALRDSITRGKMRLLITEQEFRSEMSRNKVYKDLSAEDKISLELPFIQTTLLINELVNLEYSTNGSDIKIKEAYDKRKDRYSSLSYGNYIANELERKIKNRKNNNENSHIEFNMRKPKVKSTYMRGR